MVFQRFGARDHFTRARKRDGRAIGVERSGSSFQDFYQLESFAATGYRLSAAFDAINKMLAGKFERLLLLDVRDVAVPIMIGIMKLGEGIVMRRTVDSHIVNPNLLPVL